MIICKDVSKFVPSLMNLKYEKRAMIRIRLIAYLLLVLWSLPSIGQEYPMLHFTFEDGLPSNTIYNVYRDSKGFLWIGTDKGVARYNGIKFEVFTSFDGLPDNEIYFFREDYHGRLWIATSNGKLCFFKNDTFHTEDNTAFLKLPFTLPHTNVISIEKDSSVSISPFDPNILINIKNNKVYVLHVDSVKLPSSINDYFYKRKIAPDKYVIYSRDCIYSVDTFYNFHVLSTMNYDTCLRIRFSQDQEYLANNKYLYDDQMKLIRPLYGDMFPKNVRFNHYFDGFNYFVCSKDGLFLNDTMPIIRDKDVTSITQDSMGNYWVGTLGAGIFCLRKDFAQMKKCENIYQQKLFYCKASAGRVYYTTSNNNLFVFDGSRKQTIFDYRKFVNREYAEPGGAAYLLDDKYKYFNFYNDHFIIIDDILSYPVKVSRYFHPYVTAGPKTIIANDSGVYLRGLSSLFKVNTDGLPGGSTVKHATLIPSRFGRSYNLLTDNRRNVWYSTMDNTFIIKGGKPIVQPQFKNVSLKSFEFLGDNIIGYTFNNYLLFMSNIYDRIQVDTIFSSNCTWNRLYKLNDSMMLISTNSFDRLLTLHSAGSNKYSLSVIEDPFVPLNIEAFCSDDSNCYFFKDGAITVMSINSLLKKSAAPRIFFSQLRAGGKIYRVTDEIELPYDKSRNIAISFAVHSFGGKQVSYQYSISKDGNDAWHSIKGEEIYLVNTGYGDYTVKLRARTLGSNYSTPIIFRLHILRPYWATWWFIGLCIVLAMILAAIGIRLRILFIVRKNKKEHERELKFVKSEYKALNALMNPHFIFNTLNNVQSLFNANDKLAANEYLRIFADLIRQNMHNVSKEVIPLQRELTLIMNYLMLEKLRFEDKLNYVINVDEGIDTSEFMVPPLLIQPLVENAIKHGILPMKERGGTLAINVTERDNMLCIEVKDDGVGMNSAKKKSGIMHESFGMENIRKRIEQLSIIQGKQFTFAMHEINDENGGHLWTVATVCMPIS